MIQDNTFPCWPVHICLVSHQPLANVIPWFAPGGCPQEAALLVTPQMQQQAGWLQQLAQQRGIRSRVYEVAAATDTEGLQDVLAGILEGRDTADVALNATGGTKLMALAALDWVRGLGYSAFYVDTEGDRLHLLTADSSQQTDVPLADCLKIKPYLASYGQTIFQQGDKRIPPEHKQLTQQLVEQVPRLQKELKSLNYYAGQAQDKLITSLTGAVPKTALELFAEQNVLQWDRHNELIRFTDEASRAYVNGGWLEEYVFGELEALRRQGHLRDLSVNVQVADEEGTRNEMDVLFTARNRLFLIECKTRNMQKDSARVDDALYKLRALKERLGGLFGRAMLVSYFDLQPADLDRCRSNNIHLIAGRNLPRLRELVLAWVQAS